MKLQNINKMVYRKHLNVVTIALVAGLIILSLAFGTGLIALFSEINNVSAELKSNFYLNLLGVVMAAIISVTVLMYFRHHPYMTEVYYIWRLKALHNRIYRKLKQIKSAASNHDIDALVILSFYYQSLKLVYQLDNNTLTLSKLQQNIDELELSVSQHHLTVSADKFNRDLLNKF
ncbi:MAG: DUF3087 domain-containing protein [Shewanella sp.]